MSKSTPRNTAGDVESPSTQTPTDADADQSAYPDDDYWKQEYVDDPGKPPDSGDSTSTPADVKKRPASAIGKTRVTRIMKANDPIALL